MAWTNLGSAFAYGSKLTSTQMQQLRDNIAALANGDAGAPSIQTAALANAVVTNAKIANDAVGASQLAANSVGASEIAAGAVSTSEISTAARVPSLVSGQVIYPGGVAFAYSAGDWSLPNAQFNGVYTPPSSTWTLLHTRYLRFAYGTFRFKITARASALSAYVRIYRNGSPVGTQRTLSTSDQVFIEDIAGWSQGNSIQIYGYGTSSGRTITYDVKIGTAQVYGDVYPDPI